MDIEFMAKVILSSDQNIDYLFCVPITSFVWGYFGFKPMIIILGKSKYTDLVYEYTMNYTNSEIFEIDSILPYKDCTIVQFSRLYAACLERDTNEYLLTGDIDMLILNKYLYRDFDKMNLFGPDLTGWLQYPICYIGMTTDKWRNLLNIEYDKFHENMIRDLKNDIFSSSSKFEHYWYSDQRLITKKIKQFGENNFNIIPRGTDVNLGGMATNRIDRSHWIFDLNKDYIDCHMLMPAWNDNNFKMIHDVIKNKIERNSEWMIEYREKFLEIK